jgi:SagB-type dehydrogenase family enzyme
MKTIRLPRPSSDSQTSIEEALLKRRSVREYARDSLSLDEVSQLLWAAQGVSFPEERLRTAPSAGALYPLEVYLVVGRVQGVAEGVYRYECHSHELTSVGNRDVRANLSQAALDQACIKEAAALLVFSAVHRRTTTKYGLRGERYVHMEVGHAAQNVYLQAVSLNLGTVVVGAFRDNEVKEIMNMGEEESPMCIMPVGR